MKSLTAPTILKRQTIFLIILTCISAMTYGDIILRVDDDAPEGGDGLTWETAFNTIQGAINSSSDTSTRQEIWVAEGTYTRDSNDYVIWMKQNRFLYGGFNGTETSRDQRDFRNNISTIDGTKPNGYSNGGIYGKDSSGIDGFTFFNTSDDRGGSIFNEDADMEIINCTFEGSYTREGGGIQNVDSNPTIENCIFRDFISSYDGTIINTESSPVIRGCIFMHNKSNIGAAIVNRAESTAHIINCQFFENNATTYGGAIFSDEDSETKLEDCYFRSNRASFGGAVANRKAVTDLINCIFTNNYAFDSGGALANIDTNSITSDGTINSWNCLINNNWAPSGGALFGGDGSMYLTNCTLVNNSADIGGAGFKEGGGFRFVNSIIWNNSGDENGRAFYSSNGIASPDIVCDYTCIQGWPDYESNGHGNISEDPKFDLTGTRLLPNSPCTDTGSPESSELPETTLFGATRVQNGRVDMGCAELTPGAELVPLTISIGPDEITSLSPSCQLDGGQWIENNQTIQVLPGTYHIDFKKLANWVKPDSMEITISESGLSKDFQYTYSFGNHVYFVDINATGNDDGTSWDNAYTVINNAITDAYSNFSGEVWVAKGQYTKSSSYQNNHDYVVFMKPGIHLYGGFNGNETTLEQRNWQNNESAINGFGRRKCIIGADKTVIDGFTLKDGGDGPSGGGIDNDDSSLIIKNCHFTNCYGSYGGAICNRNSSTTISACTFSNNTASNYGIDIANFESSCATIIDCSFEGGEGNCLHCHESTINLDNCTFRNYFNNIYALTWVEFSRANYQKCIIENNGCDDMPIFHHEQSTVSFDKCQFLGNHPDNETSTLSMRYCEVSISNCYFNTLDRYTSVGFINSVFTIENCIFLARNKDSMFIREISTTPRLPAQSSITNCTLYNTNIISNYASPAVNNSILWGDHSTVDFEGGNSQFRYNCVQDRSINIGSSNIYDDPLFVDATNGDFRLRPTSPCIDRGNNDSGAAQDIRGLPRPHGSKVDMGAYESWANTINDEAVLIILGLIAPNNQAETSGDNMIDCTDLLERPSLPTR